MKAIKKLLELFAWVKLFWVKPPLVQTKKIIKIKEKPNQDAPKRKYNKEKIKTLSELLDDLDYSFEAMKIDYDAFSLLNKLEVNGLKKYGVSIIPEILNDNEETDEYVKINKNVALPSILFLAKNKGEELSEESKKEFMAPDFFFAIKQKKCPWYVAKKQGTIYNCGFGFRDLLGKKIFWVSFFVTINKDREVVCTYWLTQKTVRTPQGQYTKKEWLLNNWGREDVKPNHVSNMVAKNFNAWGDRRSMWSTTVERDGHRAVFYVHPEDTKAFFKNREKTVTENGHTKKIIHLVEAHDRTYQDGRVSNVREHIRGLNKFTWNNFNCYVASPKYHFDAQNLTVESEEFDDGLLAKGYLDFVEMSEKLHKYGGIKIKPESRVLS
jgi:hypothetical protein